MTSLPLSKQARRARSSPATALGVLIVQDDQASRDMVRQVLAAKGYETAAAEHGAAALALLETRGARRPDVILLDLRMPVMDGWSFAQRYRALPEPHAPIVLLSAAGEIELAEAVTQTGAAGFLRMPFDLDALEEIVDRFAAPTPQVVPAARAKDAAETVRRRRLVHLGQEVQRVRNELAATRVELLALLDGEVAIPPTGAKRRRIRTLRLESERLRWEINTFWQEFDSLRRGAGPHT